MVRSTFNRSSVFAQYLFGIYPLFVQSMNVHILDMCHTYSEQDWSQIAACTMGVENGVCCTRRRTIPWEILLTVWLHSNLGESQLDYFNFPVGIMSFSS